MSDRDDYSHLPVGSVVGGYEILRVLGSGGFGVTYLAAHQTLGRKVALKECIPVDFAWRRGDLTVVPRGSDQAADFAWAKERFLQEARTLARFGHKNLLHVYDVFEANGTVYMATGYVEGQDLETWLRGLGRSPSESEILPLLDGLLSGLSLVHAGGVLHRDIKPENVYVTEAGHAVLLDFGSARQFIGGRSRSMTSVLTPGYAPPEQYYRDGNQGPWTDVYGLCASLHRCLCGESPPDGSARDRRGRPDPYVPLAQRLFGSYSERLLSGIDAGLELDEEKRPQSGSELRALFGIGELAREAIKPKASDQPVVGVDWTIPYLGSVMKWIKPGEFLMGSPDSWTVRGSDEHLHQVSLTQGYWLGACPVIQSDWERVMGSNPSKFPGSGNPVESVSWDDAMTFCSKFTEIERSGGRLPAGYVYSLPTEAQWEYACRAGFSSSLPGVDLGALGWYSKNSGWSTHAVGQKRSNAWGLHDMHGNVWEWCSDWYGGYPIDSVADPVGPPSGSLRVNRGGSWYSDTQHCRFANRSNNSPGFRSDDLGFRLLLSPGG